jgi:hypothetical protein
MRNRFGVWYAAIEETDPDFSRTAVCDFLVHGYRQSAKLLISPFDGTVIPATHLHMAR